MTRTDPYQDGSYLRHNPTWHVEDSAWKAKQVVQLLRDRELVPGRICEVGCGAGEILACLAREYPSATLLGYDVSEDALALSAPRRQPNVDFLLGGVHAVPDASFDVVLAMDVVEHVEDYLGFLRSLRTKGTYKVFHIPLDMTVQSVLRGSPLVRVRSSLGHLHYFTKEIALAALRETGYEILHHRYTAGGTELPNRGWKATLLRWPRRTLFAVDHDTAARVLGGYSLLVLAQ